MHKLVISFILLVAAAGCAGLNPNPGERTTDMAWISNNFQRAFEIAKPKAESGEPWAQLRLGIFYENGWGTEIDLDKAEYWYQKASSQNSSGGWAEGKLVGATGKAGYFNQNSDALIAEFNLAQLYYNSNKKLKEAYQHINNVINESNGESVFFCCQFDGGRSFSQSQFVELKKNIMKKLNMK